MRTTINIGAKLLAEAQRMTGIAEKTALVSEGLWALIERESARRLARLGETEPQRSLSCKASPDGNRSRHDPGGQFRLD